MLAPKSEAILLLQYLSRQLARMNDLYAPVSLPAPWQGKFLPCQPQDFPAGRCPRLYAQVSDFKEILDKKHDRCSARNGFFSRISRAGREKREASERHGSCEMYPQADMMGCTL